MHPCWCHCRPGFHGGPRCFHHPGICPGYCTSGRPPRPRHGISHHLYLIIARRSSSRCLSSSYGGGSPAPQLLGVHRPCEHSTVCLPPTSPTSLRSTSSAAAISSTGSKRPAKVQKLPCSGEIARKAARLLRLAHIPGVSVFGLGPLASEPGLSLEASSFRFTCVPCAQSYLVRDSSNFAK